MRLGVRKLQFKKKKKKRKKKGGGGGKDQMIKT